MRVLIGCECSGVVRQQFRKKGHDAWSCDLKPAEDKSPFHFACGIEAVINNGWDLFIGHPPCTFLCVSGAIWFDHPSYPNRRKDQAKGMNFFMKMVNASVPKIAIENPIGVMSTQYRKPNQIIHPFMFGHDCKKATCLWLKNLPLLVPKAYVLEKGYNPDKLHLLANNAERSTIRSRTFLGIAMAMADQWG